MWEADARCEINFNSYFHQRRPLRPLGEIEAEIRSLNDKIMTRLRQVAG